MDTALTPPARTPLIRARHAASLIVLGPGPTMLMGLRGAGHKFMPNKLVFPGGAVDREDATAPAASEMAPHVAAMVEKSAKPRLARAIAMAAARELDEETGLTLGTPPALAGLDYLGRAITPPVSPIRFNARFFVVAKDALSGTLAGSGELEDLQWMGVEAALALDLARPTRAVIGLLQAWLAMSPAEREARTQTPVMRNRVWTQE
jgi:8-oxo-dGTP pyrophosphatase MutT (NUDIX family)